MELSDKIISLIEHARSSVAKVANTAMVITYFQIGKLIVEELQQGESRAEYGVSLLKNTSQQLTKQLGRGFSVQNLERMRNFFLLYSKSSKELRKSDVFQKSSNSLRIFGENDVKFLPIGWSHYLFLMQIEDENERQFYEIECFNSNWKLEELKRQFNSGLYERLALSRNKEELMKLAQKGQIIQQPKDLFKEPYILEFLGLEEQSTYSETELETSIIDRIEQFMLELGKGFFFGGRQVRFSFDEEHYFVDLVFYNRLLRCFVLIDLKIGKLSHQDLGQMQMYVNYYDRFVKEDDEHPTIGIVLCKQKNENLVEITLPKDNDQIFATKYKTILPDKSTLKKLIE
ncbi:MAG: PDDEXK nuclease domain-containing protein [Chitinophagales bacterium]|nr:PDDEXK nuclease domain-containing protein [Chitinophagales bacterium]